MFEFRLKKNKSTSAKLFYKYEIHEWEKCLSHFTKYILYPVKVKKFLCELDFKVLLLKIKTEKPAVQIICVDKIIF